jgi:hypothetical protein
MSVFVKAVEKWGAASQINMAIEEMAELIVALQHFKRDRNTASDVVSEIVDVQIMMHQLHGIFHIPHDEYSAICSDKISKLTKLLEEENT